MRTPSHLLWLILPMMLLTACRLTSDDPKYHIGMSQCSDGDWRHKMNDEMYREILFYPDADLELREAHDDVDQQIRDIEYYIQKHVDLLVVSPLDAAQLTPVISRAFDAGIPVIVADRMVQGEKYTACITGDNLAVGREIAEYVARMLPEGGDIVELQGLEGSSPVTLRHQGLVEGLAKRPDVRLVASVSGDWCRDTVELRMEQLLAQYPDLRAVVAHNDAMAIDAKRKAAQLSPGNKITFVGVDALPGPGQGCEAIVQGRLNASAAYATGGNLIIQTAMHILKGEPFVRSQILDTYMVTAREEATMLNNLYQVVQSESHTIFMLQDSMADYWSELNKERAFLLAAIAFIALLLSFLIFLYRSYRYKHRTNKRLEQQRQELRQQRNDLIAMTNDLKAATHAKLNFFTNVSHDFRTPLTLISGPVEQLSADTSLTARQQSLLLLVKKNTDLLLQLINQTLDLRKYDSGKLELNLSSVDLQKEVRNWSTAFDEIARRKEIALEVTHEAGDYVANLDVPKVQRVFYNLMGNAFKFTPEHGTIRVSLAHLDDNLIMKVADTGPGIDTEHVQHIFENFYQAGAISSEGSGVGLALVKSFVELHGGQVSVSAPEVGTGTIFTVSLPALLNAQPAPATIASGATTIALATDVEVDPPEEEVVVDENETRPVILVIDDNADIRAYMRTLLSPQYLVLTARDGAQGLQKAEQNIPDAIICDVMMPGIDGLECCRRLKAGVNTCHIPVLMLTACSLDEQRIEGHRQGADAYISKPFSPQVLQAQLQSLLDNHRRIKDFFSNDAQSNGAGFTMHNTRLNDSDDEGDNRVLCIENREPNERVLSALDREFIDRVRHAIDLRLSDSDYGVEELSRDVLMSRSQLFRKLKALTGLSPFEILRNARLQKARELLATTDENIQQICYGVGFNSPSYFSKCFKEYYGILPGDVPKE